MMDYNILYKHRFEELDDLSAQSNYDVFISAYNTSDRVREAYQAVSAKKKLWLIHPEYGFDDEDLPKNQECFVFEVADTESVSVRKFFEHCNSEGCDITGSKVCIDSTGMMRPILMFLILYLNKKVGLSSFDVIYSEPQKYIKNEDTTFSKNTTGKVKGVEGFELASQRDQSNDLLIIGSGFDDVLIAEVAEAKKSAQKIQVIGFPSLQADMYQQNLYRVSKVSEMGAESSHRVYFAPANDPFETANTLKKIVDDKEKKSGRPITNLYLSPLSTKAQTIGFALFYIVDCINHERDATVIIPESMGYSDKTSVGIDHIWRYQLEFLDA